jgi:thiamine transport system permease protein
MNPNIQEAAKMLGGSPWQILIRITFPLLAPAIGSAALLVFIFCFTSFGIILILGGPGLSTIEVEIYRQAVQFFNLPMAAALSLIQIIINFSLMWLHARFSRKNRVGFFSGSIRKNGQKAKTSQQKAFLWANILLMTSLLLAPLLALLLRSFIGENGLTLTYYMALFTGNDQSVFFVPPINAILNSVGFGIGAMAIGVILALLASTYLASAGRHSGPFWDAVIMLPLATSSVTLGFGYIITLNAPPLNLRDSLALIPIAHGLVALPFVVRCILPGIRQIPQALREAAALLGASPYKVWREIDLPLIRYPILVGAIFAFSISMGEFGASSFLVRPNTPTMPIAIFRFLSQPGDMNYGQAMAMSTIFMIVTASSFWLLGRITDR